ncbi:flagellar biosynthetic protein FliO [Jeotgalibacillus marinus]|uniref:Flagellar biosynthetic protein FliO n=1 Tax=Jeotgalibacillus marinus TaxID=86667 RepID=A0ABV3Q377_9BACL
MKNRRIFPILIFVLLLSSLWLGGESSVLAEGMVDECWNNQENCNDDISTLGDEEEILGKGNPDATWVTYVKLIGALGFVLILLYGLLKFVNSRTRNFQQSKLIQNMGGTTLGGNRSVQIVKVAGSYYVLGVGEDVQLIKEVTDEKEQEKLEQYYREKDNQQMQRSPLSLWFEKLSTRNNQTSQEKHSFQSLLSKQLNQHKVERKKLFNRAKGKEQNTNG